MNTANTAPISHIIKKILKSVTVISLVIAIAIFLLLVFIIKYRIKSVIKEVVRQETHGVYELDFSKISIDFFKGRIKLKAVDFRPASAHPEIKDYRFTISQLYFSLSSWNQLFFHKKLFVDSLQINAPVITIYQQAAQKNKNGLGPIQEIFRSMQDVSDIFKVRMLEINRGRMAIYREANERPLMINNISFRVENFGQKKRANTHLRYSDNLTLHIGSQRWLFPSGQLIKFDNLFFSGKDQAFQVDSCSITTAPDNKGRRTSLFAEKLLFRTDELESVFERSELNIDTLYCKSPVLSVAMPADKKDKDTVSELNEAIQQLPGNINIKYINIENGQVHLTSSDGKRSYTGKKTNLKIYSLSIWHNPVPVIRTGRIDLNLHEISFATRDSLYLLTVKEFSFDSNNLVCKNAYLKPSPKAKGYLSGITLPAFTLFEISLNDLLEKRLKALVAVIDKPQFFFTSKAKKKTNEIGIPVNKFYSTLKDLAQLIDVRWLTIRDGTLDYTPRVSTTPELTLRNIDAEIDLVGMLNSSSLQGTKRSIHALSIGALNLDKKNITVDLDDFFVDGSREFGKLGALDVRLLSGIRLNAANLYWEGFSWEDFVRDKSIHIDTLNIPTLGFWVRTLPGQGMKSKTGLQPLTINRLNIGETRLDVKTASNAEMKAMVSKVAFKGLKTTGQFFAWQSGSARADSILFKNDHKQLTIQQMQVGQGEAALQHLTYRDVSSQVNIPQIKFQVQINNTDLEELRFPFLALYQPEITINRSQPDLLSATKDPTPVLKPFQIGKLEIIGGHFNYKQTDERLDLSAHFDAHVLGARLENDNPEAIIFDKVSMQLDSLSLDKPLSQGFITIRNASASVANYPLAVNLNSDNSGLTNVINNIHITNGRVEYYDSSLVATVAKITGKGKEGYLGFNQVVIKPSKSLDKFLKTSEWQKDYVTFSCDSIGLLHLNNQALMNDGEVAIRSVFLQGPRISTFRNKNMAFQHGIEKLMPTRLLAGINRPLRIDSIQVKGAGVEVHEVSAITNRESTIPIDELNAVFRNINSRPNEQDSLVLELSARVLNYGVRTFRYAESYQDSLSGFTMHYGISPMQLSHLTQVTNPLTAIAVTSGEADTLYANLSGNKYAAYGDINFYYRNLKVRLLNKEDTLKKNWLLFVGTLLANGVIKSSNQSQARMFYLRDREKFVFNYWIKTLFSGFGTSVGVKRNSKYKKLYNEAEEKYSLPAVSLERD
ncbi:MULTISPECIES: AsmA family protein [Niastella]|uniref:AsmA-like C-terminal domain-containing protein n=1 Tax=Niastella soli TaxID=2821487 RepID=A0ABS3YW34_9BACT|nr:hypothetical protein [Niastella soli]MBO9202141.1 hypothetical protein [Niastella soli]